MFLYFGERQAEDGSGPGRQLRGSAELSRQNVHDVQAQGFPGPAGQVLWETNSVVNNRKRYLTILGVCLYVDRASPAVREGVFQRVRDRFIEDQSRRNGLVNAQGQRSSSGYRADHHLPGNSRWIHPEGVEQ